MGKVSPQSIKYLIHVKFITEGVIEKPDVIGAVFGQTEGLLGEDLELRELQKKGKIGRINVTLEVNESKTTGEIEIPTSIDKTETTIIAAAVETIDRIGPCDARFEITSIEDVRSSKRDYIIERAKKLLEQFKTGEPRLKELEKDITEHAKTAKIRSYGQELLPAGPDIEINNELIVVEGRADILTLLKCGIKNTIAMNGTFLPKTIKELSREKEITLFVDGDRGGILISMDAIKNADIAFVARAPDGKEVEELTEKEIIICLRNKLKTDEFTQTFLKKSGRARRERKKGRETGGTKKTAQKSPAKTAIKSKPLTEKTKNAFKEHLQELEGTKNALLIAVDKSNNLKIIKKVALSEVTKALYYAGKKEDVYALIIDGLVTPAVVRAAEQANCQYITARNFAATSEKVKLLSF